MTRKVRTLGKSRLYQEERRTQSTRLSLIRVANNMFSNVRDLTDEAAQNGVLGNTGLSVASRFLGKQLNTGSQTKPHDSSGTLVFLVPKISAKFDRGHPLQGRQMQVRWVKIGDFRQITGYRPSRLCLSMSVTSRCSTKTAKRKITLTTPHRSPGILVFWCQKLGEIRTGSPRGSFSSSLVPTR